MQEPYKFCSVCGAGMNIGGEVCERCQSRANTPMRTHFSKSFQKRQEVTVADIEMPFWSMVVFMVKWAIAAIPAMIILFFIGIIFFAILAGMRGPQN